MPFFVMVTDTILYIGFKKNEVAGEYICFEIDANTKRSILIDTDVASVCGTT